MPLAICPEGTQGGPGQATTPIPPGEPQWVGVSGGWVCLKQEQADDGSEAGWAGHVRTPGPTWTDFYVCYHIGTTFFFIFVHEYFVHTVTFTEKLIFAPPQCYLLS